MMMSLQVTVSGGIRWRILDTVPPTLPRPQGPRATVGSMVGDTTHFLKVCPTSWKRSKDHNAYLIHSPSPPWQQPVPHGPAADAVQATLTTRDQPWNVKYTGRLELQPLPDHPGRTEQ